MKLSLKHKICSIFRCGFAVILTVIMFFSFTSIIYFIPDNNRIYAETLEEELKRVKQERESTQKKIEQAKIAEAEYVSQVNRVEGDLVTALSELDELNQQTADIKSCIDKLTVDLVLNERDLAEIEKQLQEKNKILNDRAATIYKNREQDILQLFFETDSFLEFFSSLKLMNLILQQDMNILNEVQQIRNMTNTINETITGIKEEEQSQKAKMEELVCSAEQKKRDIEDIYAEKKNLLRVTKANKEALIKMDRELAEKEKEITKLLEALRHGTAPGKLLYPARGVLTSGFGYRISPISGVRQFHGGIDIGAATGTPIMAAASGEVIGASYMGGYGYSILVYHGGGFATFYAHLSGFAVSVGQGVKQGQVIGYMGSTGYSTGPHLHFEVRVNGAQQNPYNYF
jgi:murein DD-endopeptidase MepM/ murein hydrolase activator NlpD